MSIREDQLVYGILFVVPYIMLIIDWYFDITWNAKLIDYIKIPWAIILCAYIILQQQWGVFAIAFPIGLGLFTFKVWKR